MDREELLELLKPIQKQFKKTKEELNNLHIEIANLEKIFLRVGKVPKEITRWNGKKGIAWVDKDTKAKEE